jgi:hypothetical protein
MDCPRPRPKRGCVVSGSLQRPIEPAHKPLFKEFFRISPRASVNTDAWRAFTAQVKTPLCLPAYSTGSFAHFWGA